MASTKNKVVLPLGKTQGMGTGCYGYPAPTTKMTKVEPHLQPNVPQAANRTNTELKVDEDEAFQLQTANRQAPGWTEPTIQQ